MTFFVDASSTSAAGADSGFHAGGAYPGGAAERHGCGVGLDASSDAPTSRHGAGALSFPHAIEIPASAAATNFARRARMVRFASSVATSPPHASRSTGVHERPLLLLVPWR